MKAIKLTEEKRDKVLLLIDYFYEDGEYGSYDNFKKETNSNIDFPLSEDGYFLLSESAIKDHKYGGLITFLMSGMGNEFQPVEASVKKAVKIADLNG
jgi:hypothetical protein